MVVARTGLNAREALEAGYQPYTCSFETTDHKGYYRPAYNVKIRFTADQKTQKILGCQIIGVIQAEFIMLDLSYTPPLSSPWDPVQMAAAAWLNQNAQGGA